MLARGWSTTSVRSTYQKGMRVGVGTSAVGEGGGAQHSKAAGRLITDSGEVGRIAAAAKRVAVLGCKTEQQASQPAFFVPQYLANAGVEILPVPVFYPDVTHILEKQVYRKVSDIPVPYDVLVMFRKPSDLMGHLDDILAAHQKPTCVWLQSGITHPGFEGALIDAGFLVVADRCIKVEHQMAAMSSNL